MLTAALHKYAPLDHLTFFFKHTLRIRTASRSATGPRCRASATSNPHLDHEEEAVDVPVGIVDFGKKPDWRFMLACHVSGAILSAAHTARVRAVPWEMR